MSLIRNTTPPSPTGQPPQGQQPPRPTLRDMTIKSLKKSTLLCVALAILAVPLAIIDQSDTFLGSLFGWWKGVLGLWIFLMVTGIFIAPAINVWWKKTTEASQNFWDQRM